MSGDEVDEVMREYRRYCGGLERQVHECGAEAEEVNGPERLSKEICEVVGCSDVGHCDRAVFDEFTDSQMASVDVLRMCFVRS